MADRTVQFRVRGRKPGLLTHNPASMGRGGGGPSRRNAPIFPPEVEAENGVYRTPEGYCAIPGNHFRAAIVAASGGFKAKRGRGSLKTVVSHILVVEELCPLVSTNPGGGEPLTTYKTDSRWPLTTYDIDSRRAVVQRQGIVRSRPLFREWETTFTVEFDDEILEADVIKAVLVEAGRKVGVGDYRPTRSGPFGRFDVLD